MNKHNPSPGSLYIGWASADITPAGPAILYGQFYDRLSRYVQSPLTVTVCAIESIYGDEEREQAVMVSLDLTRVWSGMQEVLRNKLRGLIPDFDMAKLFLHATHTHSAPKADIESDYGKFVLKQISSAVVTAWNNRAEAGISRALGYAVVGHNRRARYADGTARMYGATNRQDFIGMEGPADQGVNMLFCWDQNKALTGIIMNVPCPAQVTESKYYVSSDYWSEVRAQLEKALGKKVYVLAQCGAAGDISPRDLPRGYRGGEPNMWDVPGIAEIGKRLVRTVMDAYPDAGRDVQTEVVFKHVVEDVALPARQVGKQEYKDALKISNEIHAREPGDPDSPETAWNRFLKEIEENEKARDYGPWDDKKSDFGLMAIKDAVIEQYNNQEQNPFYEMELHVIRMGDIVIASNPFELFVDYGFQIMGRSKAEQTFVVQLSCDYGDYLPTETALQGGGYSAEANPVGTEGGSVLVEKTLEVINNMWE